jgi:dienelactone hydrolase
MSPRVIFGVLLSSLLGTAGSLGAAEDLGALLARPILATDLPTVEIQVFAAVRVPPMPPVADSRQWTEEAARLRRRVIDEIILRGEARRWAEAAPRIEWLETLPGDGTYHIRKLRYEALPGLWIPALFYEPTRLNGRVPAVLNVNGHEKTGKSTPYIQERCINLAKRGIPALNPEWLGRGQLTAPGFSHYRMNQLDLCGTSGLAVFYLTLKRSLDLLCSLEHTDPARVAVTGLSGGGWQTIMISALDPRVGLANPVAGYSSYVTRTQFPALDLGDSEQTPNDLGTVLDYTHLTAMVAPRPLLLTYNAKDNCCFRADYALPPLIHAAKPIFALTGAGANLRHHVNHDAGHNYGADNREAFYRMLRDHFFPGQADFPEADIPSQQEVRSAEQLHVAIPDGNHDFHSLALALSESLPRAGLADRANLARLVRAPAYLVKASAVDRTSAEAIDITRWRLRMNNDWTVPAVEFTPAGADSTVVLVADKGRASAVELVRELLEQRRRVVAIDPFGFGESRLAKQAGLFSLLVAALGERPLGIQAGQVAAVARWLQTARQTGPVGIVSVGPRSSLFALVAAALEPGAIARLEQQDAMVSLREIITKNLAVDAQPEQFCFGLLEAFDLPQLAALVSPRPIVKR